MRLKSFIILTLIFSILWSCMPKKGAIDTADSKKNYFQVGLEEYNTKHYDNAIRFFKHDAEKNANANAYFYLGMCYLYADKGDKTEEIMALWGKGLQLDPTHVPMHFNLGKLYYQNMKYSNALEHFLFIKSAADAPEDIVFWIGNCYLGMSKYEEAKNTYKELYDKKQGDKEFILNYALALYKYGARNKAVDILEKVLVLYPNDTDLSYLLADIYRAKGKVTEAMKYFNVVVQSDSKMKENALDNIAKLYYDSKQYSKAVEAYENLLKLYPDKIISYYYIALSYEKMNQSYKAVTYWKIFVEKGQKIFSLNEMVEYARERINSIKY